MSNLAIFARACLLSGAAISCSFYLLAVEAAAAEFRSINEMLGFEGDLLGIPWVSVTTISGDGSKIGGLSRSYGFIDDCANLACSQNGFVLSLEENAVLSLPVLPITPTRRWKGLATDVVSLSYDGSIAAVDFDLNDGNYQAETSLVRDGKILALRERVAQENVLRATGISSGGTMVVGSLGNEPFLWTEFSGLQSLPGIASDSPYDPVTISGDGGVVLFNDRSTNQFLVPDRIYQNALRLPWAVAEGPQELFPLPGADYSQVKKTSFDGSVTVGASYLAADLTSQATVWVNGSPTLLEVLSDYSSTSALDVSAVGLHIVGSASNDSNVTDVFRFPQAILWRDGEAFVLQDLLKQQYGLANELAGWHLTSATAVSYDGTVIAGEGIDPDGLSAAWVATLVIPEPASLALLLCLLMPMAAVRATPR